MKEVLAGVRVVEVASWTFVPGAGAVLADWGADVIKVEHPVSGDPQRGLMTMSIMGGDNPPPVNFMIEQPNRGKRSIGLDIASEDGRELLYRLVERADVFLTNLLPAPRAKLQIDVEHLRARNPQLIYVRGSGMGATGPEADKAAYDASAYWARGGMGHALTPPDRPFPIGQRPAIGDLPSAMAMAGGVAAALFRRERTGVPSEVDVSLLGCAMWTLSPDLIGSRYAAGMMSFSREEAPNPIVNQYRTSDGRFISLAMLQSDRFWPGLCQALGRPDLVEDSRFAGAAKRFENRRECVAALDEVFEARPLAEWRARLRDVEGVWEVYQTPGELLADPQAEANGYLPELKASNGASFNLVASPVQFDRTPPELEPAPEHGQHTEEVLLELGLSWEQIAQHKERGAVL